MALKKLKPTTPGSRFTVTVDYSELSNAKPEKSLIRKLKKSGGRNSSGRMTIRYKGGGHKRKYRVIDFKRENHGVKGEVKTLEYDPNRTAFIALIEFTGGEKRYILAPDGLKVGDTIISGTGASPDLGNCLPLGEMPLGTVIHNIELHPGNGGVMARSAGSYGQITNKEGKYAILRMPSGENRMVLLTCTATVGSVSNSDHSLTNIGKAGRNRWLGKRPRVRGVVMNPVDHPMGGGEGKSSGGHPRSRTGIMAKGQKTRNKKKASNKFIVSRRKK